LANVLLTGGHQVGAVPVGEGAGDRLGAAEERDDDQRVELGRVTLPDAVSQTETTEQSA
jgi:hypothetical protein